MAKDGNRQKFANLDHGSGYPQGIGDAAGGEGAGEGNGDDGGEGDDGDSGEGDPAGGEAKHTDAEVDAIVEKRLARERAKMEREIRKQVEDEANAKATEAEKLKGMTELERAKSEAKKLKEEKAALQQKIDLAEQTAIARSELAEEGIHLSDGLLSMFVSPDAEETDAAIKQLKECWTKEVNDAAHEKLKRTPPPADRPPSQKSYGAEYAEEYSKSKFNDEGGIR